MSRKVLLVLCGAVLIWTMVPVSALAVPMQRTVTVVDEGDNIVFRENILYNNTYKAPEVKITPAPAVPTIDEGQKRVTAPTTSRSGTDVRLVLKTAHDLLGKSYSYGGGGPNSFDCSGFTMYVFRQHGVNLPHNAADQFKAGMKLSRDQLAAGDLVFFSYYSSAGIQHVGIYIGDGQFIHSSTSRGVIISSMNAQYYASNYKGAARVIR